VAKKRQAVKSFRALAGVADNGREAGPGMLLLDSNDTGRYYAFFSITSGLTPEAEAFVRDYISGIIEPYSEVYKNGDLSKPGAFLKSMAKQLYGELVSRGYLAAATQDPGFAIVMVKQGTAYVARVNGFPALVLKERQLRHIFNKPRTRGPESVQVAGTQLDNGDTIVLGSEDTLRNITELELRSILTGEQDLSIACSRINNQAAKNNKEINEQKVMVLSFRRKLEKTQTMLTRRNAAIFAGLAVVVLLFFLWGEIARYLSSGPMSFLMDKDKSVVRKVMEKVSMPRASSFVPELVYDRLTVPYDVTIDKDGTLYIVDDKEEKIVRYNPESGETGRIGEKVDLSFPTGIDLYEDRLYVADFNFNVSKVYIFSKTGSYLGQLPDKNSRMVSMSNPKAVEAVENENVVYVCDRRNNRILKFDRNGTFLSSIDMPSGFREPNGIAITEGGIIYFTLKLSGTVGRISSQNNVNKFTIFEETPEGNRQVELAKPSGIAVDESANIYIADTANHRIVIANQMGKLITVLDSEKLEELETYYPMSLKLGPHGDYVYLVTSNRYSYDITCGDKCNGKVWRIKI